jgi:hypothetical protein
MPRPPVQAITRSGRNSRDGARDLCQTPDTGLPPKQIEGMRAKLERLVSRGILTETEPGLFTQPRP